MSESVVFQSLIGRLVTQSPASRLTSLLPFQSLIGRLVTFPEPPIPFKSRSAFQSLIGRLVTRVSMTMRYTDCCFNPL